MYHPRTMKSLMLILIVTTAAWSQEQEAPFRLSVVPSSSHPKYGTSISRDLLVHDESFPVPEFYLVLTNISHKPQPVFEFSNSWGAASISMEITTADGKKHVL